MRNLDGNTLGTRSFVALIAVVLCAGVALAETETVGLAGSDWHVFAVMVPGLDGSVAIGGSRADEEIIGFWGGDVVVDGNVVANYDMAAIYEVELVAATISGQSFCAINVTGEGGEVIYAGFKTIGPEADADTASASGDYILVLMAN